LRFNQFVARAFESGEEAVPGVALSYLYFTVGMILVCISLFVKPNAGSLHSYYRDRLSRAFLWKLDELKREALHDRGAGCAAQLAAGHEGAANFGVDDFKFTSLKKRSHAGGWANDIHFAPYLLVNSAVNLEGSKYLNRRGRNADSFVFSPLFMGSEATGYVESACLEAADSNINLGTAMAASGAAVSANMGANTIKLLTFSLAALNIRLGYWIPNPRYAHHWKGWNAFKSRIGPWYYVKETFGWLGEWSRNIYLTDGGHFDNLGVYELLKRRCKLIIAVDAEADSAMNFDSLIRLQRYARIDFGIRIHLPWAAIRQVSLAVSPDCAGPQSVKIQNHGPHVAVGHIDYGEDESGAKESGILIYVKASLSGDEIDLIRDYKRRNHTYPHETTLDQFFGEEQFEVYRALGFHAAHRFFVGADTFGKFAPDDYAGWITELDDCLTSLGIPLSSRAKIQAYASARPVEI